MGDYTNTSKDRIKDTLAKAQFLLDDPFDNGNSAAGMNNYGNRPQTSNPYNQGARSGSQPPMSHGGMTRSNYTQSEGGESDYDTHSQMQGKRRQWGNPLGQDESNYRGQSNEPLGFKMQGGGDLAGITEIGVIGGSNSRRNSLKYAGDITRNSESRERGRDQSSSHIQNNIPRPNNSNHIDNLGLKRPQTSDPFAIGLSGALSHDPYTAAIGGAASRRGNLNQYSEAASSYKDDDDALSHYMGQSEYGALSQIGKNEATSNLGLGGIPTLDGVGRTPSRRMAGKPPSQQDSQLQQPTLKSNQSKNYGLFLQEDTNSNKIPPSQLNRRQTGDTNSNQGANDRSSISPPTRDPNQFKDLQFGRPATGGNVRQTNGSTMNLGLGTFSQGFGDTNSLRINGTADNNSSKPLFKDDPLLKPLTGGSALNIKDQPQSLNMSRDDKFDKEAFFQRKKKEEIDRLESELQVERGKLSKLESDYQRQIDTLKEKNKKDLESIEDSQKITLDLLLQEKEKTMETLQEAISREKQKMEVLHQADLESKERQHQNQLEQQKRQLEKETQHLEEQLSQQQELRDALEKVQQKTVDLSEIVHQGLKQREDEIRRRELDMIKKERQVQEQDEIDIALEEKKLEEEERKLQRLRDELVKQKQNNNDELERLRNHRKQLRLQYEYELNKQKQDERSQKECLNNEKVKIETESEKRKAKKRILEIELANKENEVDNLRNRITKEKDDFENEFRERQIREIQIQQIKIEERREQLSVKEQELRKKWRFLEKKKELLQQDIATFQSQVSQFQIEKTEFDEWAVKIRETSQRLADEREKVLQEKSEYDLERETIEKWKMDLDLQRSILQSDYVRAEELEHELDHREKMLQMLKFNKEVNNSEINVPPYSSCPALKVDPRQFMMQQHQQPMHSHSMQHQQYGPMELHLHDHSHAQSQHYPEHHNMPHNNGSSIYYQDQPQVQQYQDVPLQSINTKRFDYNNYVKELQSKLGNDSMFRNSNKPFNDYITNEIENFKKDLSQNQHQNDLSMSQVRSGGAPVGDHSQTMNDQSNSFGGNNAMGFREKLKARLGNAQLSESKNFYYSSGVEEQENEDSGNNLQEASYGSEY